MNFGDTGGKTNIERPSVRLAAVTKSQWKHTFRASQAVQSQASPNRIAAAVETHSA